MKNVLNIDKYLLIALLSGLILCLHGIHWGRVETWNIDQAIYNRLDSNFKPKTYKKPPLHTYLGNFLVVKPIRFIKKIYPDIPYNINTIELISLRLLTTFMFLGSVVLVFKITNNIFGLFPARVFSILLSTSAGFISESHLIQLDVPLVFWMLLTLYFAQNILTRSKTIDYLLAGIFTGLATATKYNGIIIILSVVLAHISLYIRPLSIRKMILSKKIYLSFLMLLLGFFVANPFSLIEYQKFISGILYSLYLSPNWHGTTGTSYTKFINSIVDLIGMPSFIIFSTGFVFGIYNIFKEKLKTIQSKFSLIILITFLVYFIKFGNNAYLPTRWVMAIVPLWLMISAPLLNEIKKYRILVIFILVITLSYNFYCSYFVGKRFIDDPRMQFQEWSINNIPNGSKVLTFQYSPDLNRLNGKKVETVKWPFFGPRAKKQIELFKDNKLILPTLIASVNRSDKSASYYNLDNLINTKSDFIVLNSKFFNRFMYSDNKNIYPHVTEFFNNLIEGNYPYKIIFDKKSKKPPSWIYPKRIQNAENRLIVFKLNKL